MSSVSQQVEERWQELCEQAKQAGKSVEHCRQGDCFSGQPEVDVCSCDCEACQRSNSLMVQAQEELEQ